MKKHLLKFLLALFLFAGWQSSFGQDTPDNWTGDTGIDIVKETTTVHSGGSATSAKIVVNTGTQANCDFRNETVIPVTEGDTYTFKSYVYSSAHVRATLVLTWSTGTITYSGTYTVPGSTDFDEYTYSGTVPTGATTVIVGLRFYDVSGFVAGEIQYVDDVTFESPTATPLTVTNGDLESWTAPAPIISNYITSPSLITDADAVLISADVDPNTSTVNSVNLNWGTTSGVLGNTIAMTESSGTWTANSNIPAQTAGTFVYYEIEATYNTTETKTSSEQFYSVQTDVASITDLRAGVLNGIYKLTTEAIITFNSQNFYNQKYLFDGTAGILIHDPDGIITTPYIVGDGITGIIGTLTEYNGLLEFVPETDPGATTSTGNAIVIQTPTMADFQTNFEDYESELVRFTNATVNSAPASGKFNITDGITTLTVDDNFYSSAETGVLIGRDLTITGFAYQNTDALITPRDAADKVSATDTVGSAVYTVNQGDLTITGVPYTNTLATFEANIVAADSATFVTYLANGTTPATTDVQTGYKVIVTAADGITEATYTITTISPNTDATLSSLTSDLGTLVPVFAAGTFAYTVVIPYGTINTPVVTATETDPNANAVVTDATDVSSAIDADRTTTITVTAEDGSTTEVYTILFNVAANDAKELTAFSFVAPAATGIVTEVDHTVAIEVPYGTDVTALVATFSSTGAEVKVGATTQVSGTTPNNFTNPVTYTVGAADASTQDYTVTVTIAAPNTDATLSSLTVDLGTLDPVFDAATFVYNVELPYGTTATPLVTATTTDANAEAIVTPATDVTSTTEADRTTTVVVTAEDGLANETYTVIFAVDATAPTDLFFSEYIEGSSNNRAFEIYNPTGASVDLSGYTVKQSHNGTGWGVDGIAYVLPLEGTLTAGDVYVIANAEASAAVLAEADTTFLYSDVQAHKITAFTGDDALGLFKGDVLIDVIGIPTEDPGTGWNVAGVTEATVNHTLLRKLETTIGNTDWVASAGTNTTDSEWEVYRIDALDDIGKFGIKTGTDIFTFDFVGLTTGEAIIDATNHTVAVEIIDGTSPSALVATFNLSIGASAKVGTTVQVSGTTANDFTSPVTYVVTAEDASSQNWVVTVTTGTLNEVANIAALRALYSDTNTEIYKLTGEVTFTHTTSPYFYIQDETAAILVYNSTSSGVITTSYNIGDNVQNLVGTFATFGGNMQFVLNEDPGAAISSGNTIAAQAVTIPELASNYTNYDAELIMLEDVTFSETVNFEAGTNYTLNNGSDQIAVRTQFSSADYIGTAIPTDKLDVTAIAGIYNSTIQVYPRSLADFVVVTGIGTPDGMVSMNIFPNPSNGLFNLEMNASKAGSFNVEIINIQGQVVYSKQINQDGFYKDQIDISKEAKGIYYIRINDGVDMQVSKIMIQ